MKHLAAKTGEFAEAQCKILHLEGKEVGLFLVDGEYRAYRNMCPHAGAPLCDGGTGSGPDGNIHEYYGGRQPGSIRCPWHGWEFDLATGRHSFSKIALREYAVTVEGEEIYIEIPEAPPRPAPVAPASAVPATAAPVEAADSPKAESTEAGSQPIPASPAPLTSTDQ